MSKLYKGNVTLGLFREPVVVVPAKIGLTGFPVEPAVTKMVAKDLRLKADPNGAFNSENASELLAKADEMSKKHKVPLNTWSFWFPLGRKKGLVPCLLAAKWGKPKLVLLKPLPQKGTPTSKFEPLA
tara:strand:+ start:341 stop:721 length:381 start_codon:yes stop_codon:yes gene_type:complete